MKKSTSSNATNATRKHCQKLIKYQHFDWDVMQSQKYVKCPGLSVSGITRTYLSLSKLICSCSCNYERWDMSRVFMRRIEPGVCLVSCAYVDVSIPTHPRLGNDGAGWELHR